MWDVANIDAERKVKSVYSEFLIPVFDNIEMQIALRYEDYNDFGDVTKPKLAVSWRPDDNWLLRASWGESFKAPSLVSINAEQTQFDGILIDSARCESLNIAVIDCPVEITPILWGGNPDLKPESGESRAAECVTPCRTS